MEAYSRTILQDTKGLLYRRRTFSIASFTRSDSIRPFCARLLTRAALELPELRHAILTLLVVLLLVPPMERKRFVRNGSVKIVKQATVTKSLRLEGGGALGRDVLYLHGGSI
jgi:hypothetical protein